MLAAVLAAQHVTDRAPDNPETPARVARLLQPVARRLDQLNDHQGRLARFGAGNLAGQTALDMSQAAIDSWLRRLKLGARIRTDELVTRFRAGAEPIRFLTGERRDAPTLRAFDRASHITALGAAGLVLAPALLAVAAEEAPLLAIASRAASQRVVLWALTHPAAALAASEALLGLGVQIGQDGWQPFWDQLQDPHGRWLVLAQALMDYMHVRGGMSGHAATADPPARRPSSPAAPERTPSRGAAAPSARAPGPAIPASMPAAPVPTPPALAPRPAGSEADIPGARARAAKLIAVVQQIRDGARTPSERGHPASATGSKPPPRRETKSADAPAPTQEPATRARAEADNRKPVTPAAHDEPVSRRPPRITDDLDNEIPASHGRGLPECPVARSTLAAEVIEADHRLEYVITGKTPTGKQVDFGSVELELTPQGDPAKPPTMSLGASAFIDGAEYAAHIYDEIVIGPGGHATGRGQRTSLTRHALTSFGQFYERRFGHPLKAWRGRLAFQNKLNFQREYVRLREEGVPAEVAKVEAVRRISYGIHRIDEGFTKLTVDVLTEEDVNLGEPFGTRYVPTDITILAEKP